MPKETQIGMNEEGKKRGGKGTRRGRGIKMFNGIVSGRMLRRYPFPGNVPAANIMQPPQSRRGYMISVRVAAGGLVYSICRNDP